MKQAILVASNICLLMIIAAFTAHELLSLHLKNTILHNNGDGGVRSIHYKEEDEASSRLLPDQLRKLWCFDRNVLDNPRRNNISYPEYTKGIAWVSEKYKILYLQNPKSGSTSIANILRQMNNKSFVSKERLFHDVDIEQRQLYRDYFTFTFIRNPITRFVSGYYTIQGRPDKALCQADGRNDLDFFTTLQEPTKFQHVISRLIAQDVHCWTTHHTFPQTFFTTDLAGVPFRLDFIGHLESIHDDWERLRQLVPHVPLPPMKTATNVAEGQGQTRRIVATRMNTTTATVSSQSNNSNSYNNGTTTQLQKLKKNNKLLDWLLTDKSAETTLYSICNYLKSDFMCFDFDFPKQCQALSDGQRPLLSQSRSEAMQRIFPTSY